MAERGFVGRQGESKALDELLVGVRTLGSGRAVLVRGEAGVGKSTLVDAFLRRAEGVGTTVLRGRSFPLDATVPYAPVVSALGNHLRRLPAAERAALVEGLGALGLIFDDVAVASSVLSSDAAMQRTRLFESVARLVARLSDVGPVILAIDDLQWTDQSSTELVQHVTRDLSSLPVLLAFTVRPTDLDTRRWIRSLVQSLRRTGELTELDLARFARDDLQALVQDTFGVEGDDDVLDFLERRSAGVPFFADVLLRDAHERGALVVDPDRCRLLGVPAAPPREVRDEITDRFAHLGAPEQAIVDVLAVSGDPLPADLLDQMLVEPRRVRDDVSSLVRRGIVRETATDLDIRLELAHPLYTEVAYDELTAGDRRQLHHRVALALTSRDGVAPVAVARHLRLAGGLADERLVADSLLAAAADARRHAALDDAAQLMTDALPAVRSTYDAPAIASVLESLARIWSAVGEAAAAAEVLAEAVVLRRATGEAEALAETIVRQSEVSWALGLFDAAAGQAAEARGIRERSGDVGAVALAIYHTMAFQGRAGALDGFDTLAAELDEVARRADTPMTDALAAVGRVSAWIARNQWSDVQGAMAALRSAADGTGDPRVRFRVLGMEVDTAMALGDAAWFDHATRASSALAAELELSAFDHRSDPARFFNSVLSARWDEAQDQLVEWRDRAERASIVRGIASSLAGDAWMRALMGDADAAHAGLDRARLSLDTLTARDVPAACIVASMQAHIGRDLGDDDLTAAALDDLQIDFCAGFPILPVAARGYALVARGRLAEAFAVASALEANGPAGSRPVAEGLRLRGFAARRSGPGADGETALRAAAALYDELGQPFEAARTRLELHEDPDALTLALEVFEACGARVLAARAARSLGGAPPRREDRRPASADLTPREREVAMLVAQGLTNAQIAERLFISVRTVTSHLDHAYTRLGISSRAALAVHVTTADSH